MRRVEAEEAKETGDQQRSILEIARRRVRRFLFSASRTMWFSACELATFLMTGDTAVKTEGSVKTSSGRGMAMMHECKRILNNSTVFDGLLVPGRHDTGRDDGVAHLLVVPHTTAIDAKASSAAEQAAMDSGDNDAQEEKESPCKRPRKVAAAIDANASSAAEQAAMNSGDNDSEEKKESPCKRPREVADEDADEKDTGNRDSEDNNCDLPAGGDSTITNNKKQAFSKTYTHRADWLHW